MHAKTPVLVAGIVSTFIAAAASADFSSASWTLNTSGLSGGAQFAVGQTLSVQAGGGGGSGSLTASTMELFGGNASARSLSWYSTVASGAGTISVDWAYSSAPGNDSAGWDGAGWVLNGVFTVLAINAGSPASGTLTFSVNAGDTFGFGAATVDGLFGSGTATFTNFVPAPGAVGLLAMAGLAGSRRRR
ncbi:MAG: hypothetical protein GC172_12090 [Phycisphaera sp.]|nr:hypothetical protein [Phycisphaera sp.]